MTVSIVLKADNFTLTHWRDAVGPPDDATTLKVEIQTKPFEAKPVQ
jgi:hypothetical protein